MFLNRCRDGVFQQPDKAEQLGNTPLIAVRLQVVQEVCAIKSVII